LHRPTDTPSIEKKGLSWPVLEHGSGDKIIIINPRDSQNQGYFNPNQDNDKGTLIQFVTNRLGWLFPQDQSQSTPWNVNQVLHQWLNMPFRERLYQSKVLLPSKHGDKVESALFNKSLLKPLKDLRWLQSRGISKATIESPLFRNCIRECKIKGHVNTAFPYRASAGGEIIGAELRNQSFKGHMTGSRKSMGIWFSELIPDCQRIVICESALDCLSHSELTRDNRTVYISFGGQLTMGQLEVIRNLHSRLSEHHSVDVMIGVDSDEKGQSYAGIINKIFPDAIDIRANSKDFNELVSCPQKHQNFRPSKFELAVMKFHKIL
jgi:hypothetical protein